jgi:hypothetical protein
MTPADPTSYFIIITLFAYLLIGMFSRKIVFSPIPSPNRFYAFYGTRAVLVSAGLLFLSLFILIAKISDTSNPLNLNLIISMLLPGFVTAFILHRILLKVADVFENKIPEKLKKRQRTKKNIVEWGFAGAAISLPVCFLLFAFAVSTINVLTAIIICTITFLIFICFFAFWGSGTHFY